MKRECAPYGRQRERSFQPSFSAYEGETYYQRPALKPSPYGWLIATYLYVGGLAGAAELIVTIADWVGRRRDRGIVRMGRYLALGGALISPILLIADLHKPERWYNMLRIFCKTSPMSIGAWILMAFGMSLPVMNRPAVLRITFNLPVLTTVMWKVKYKS